MIKIDKPDIDVEKIIDNCLAHMYNPRKSRILKAKKTIVSNSNSYDKWANSGDLWKIKPSKNVGSYTNDKDMKLLYEDHFVGKKEIIGDYYNQILASTEFICPYFGQPYVETFDHYMPKANYGVFSVTPQNLIPSCNHCNKTKGDPVYSSESELPYHPYFDKFDTFIWLKAELQPGKDVCFLFSVETPPEINPIVKQRLETSVSLYGWDEVFMACAAKEFKKTSMHIELQCKRGTISDGISYVNDEIAIETQVNGINNWKNAMLRAILKSDWYWNTYLPSVIVLTE